MNGESGGHVLSPPGLNFTGGYKHEPDLVTRVKELNGAVVVRESGAVRVSNGDVLREGEVGGVVGDGEGRELDGVDGDLGVFWFEDGEVNDEEDGE